MEPDEASPELEAETPRSRRRFLKQLGVTLVTAVGAGVLAKNAFAAEGTCCRDCSCGSCANGCYCRCDCGGAGSYCYTVLAGCIDFGAGSCSKLCPC
jgi:hypothetical protein